MTILDHKKMEARVININCFRYFQDICQGLARFPSWKLMLSQVICLIWFNLIKPLNESYFERPLLQFILHAGFTQRSVFEPTLLLIFSVNLPCVIRFRFRILYCFLFLFTNVPSIQYARANQGREFVSGISNGCSLCKKEMLRS